MGVTAISISRVVKLRHISRQSVWLVQVTILPSARAQSLELVFLTAFFTSFPASLKGHCNVMKTFAQGYETSESEWDHLLWLQAWIPFPSFALTWGWKTVASMLRMVLRKPLLPRWSRAVSAPQCQLPTSKPGHHPHENKAVNLTALGDWDHWIQSRIW